jgi:hypothetical protein
MTLIFIAENSSPNYIALSSDISGGQITGASMVGGTVLLTDTGAWKIIGADLSLIDYVLPVSGGGATPVPVKYTWSSDAPPVTATAQDDEFNDGSINVKWTEIDHDSVLTASEETTFPHMRLTAITRAGRNVCGLAQSIPAGDFTIVSKVHMASSANYAYIGLAMWESLVADSDIYTTTIKQEASASYFTVAYLTNRNTQSTTPHNVGGNTYGAPIRYIRIRRNSTNYYHGYSIDGIHWYEPSAALNPSFTPTYFGIMVDNYGTGADLVGRFDFFRYIASDVGKSGIITGRKVGIYT